MSQQSANHRLGAEGLRNGDTAARPFSLAADEGQKPIAGDEDLRIGGPVEYEVETNWDRPAGLMRTDWHDRAGARDVIEREGRLAAVGWRDRIGRAITCGRIELALYGARIADTVAVEVDLVGIGERRTVVAAIVDTVAIGIENVAVASVTAPVEIAIDLRWICYRGTIVLFITDAVAVCIDIAEAATRIADVAE